MVVEMRMITRYNTLSRSVENYKTLHNSMSHRLTCSYNISSNFSQVIGGKDLSQHKKRIKISLHGGKKKRPISLNLFNGGEIFQVKIGN
jgi:hypothetical protein